MKIFNLPDLGEGLPEAEIHEWYVQEGDEVKVDQPMVAMETAKAIVDVPSPFAGKIAKCYGKPGELIKTGSPLVSYETEDTGTVVGNLETSDIVLTEPVPLATPLQNHTIKPKALPVVRNLAKQLNVDIDKLQGTGKSGMITSEDVLKAANYIAAKQTEAVQGEQLYGVRRAMAAAMTQSHAEVVPVTIFEDADIHAWQLGTDITVRVIRAVVKACQAEPALNAWFNGKTQQRLLHSQVDLGIAMDTADGLFVPVVKNAGALSSTELRQQIDSYKKQVQSRNIAPSAMLNPTIVLSNFGIFAGRYANPIVVPPTVAILATGKIRDDVVAYNGQALVHRIIPLSLTFDHRAITGGEATRFMMALLQDLQLAE